MSDLRECSSCEGRGGTQRDDWGYEIDPCPVCGGSGLRASVCPSCIGQGVTLSPDGLWTPRCERCGGTGYLDAAEAP